MQKDPMNVSPLTIGNVKLATNLPLAPIAGPL